LAPTVQQEPLGASLAEKTSSGSKALPLLVVAMLIIAAAASYFYFSSSSTQDASAPASQALDTASAQPAAATPATPPPTSPPIEEASNQTQPTAEEAPAAAPDVVRSAGVEALIKAATSDDASQLEALIRELESEPAPAVGNRGEARRINYRALPLLREKRYLEAVPILEEARLADESDVEVVGNLADTLMRAGRLDEAWGVALEALRLAPRRTVGWSTIGMLSAKRDDAPGAVACLLTAYRFSNAQPTTLKVYSKLATSDEDPKVRAALEETVERITAMR
jgi:Flp pilus assembly protein TadD